MKRRLKRSLVVMMFLLVIFRATESGEKKKEGDTINYGTRAGVAACDYSSVSLSVVETEVETVAEPEEIISEIPKLEDSRLYIQYNKMGFTDEDFYNDLELLAEMTLAEAGNQSELGKRLVIDTVLNRIDSPVWRDDDTIREVITHPGQYETYSNGSYARQQINEDIVRLVEDELFNRTNREVIYFRTGYFFDGVPRLFQEGDHYFSGDSQR